MFLNKVVDLGGQAAEKNRHPHPGSFGLKNGCWHNLKIDHRITPLRQKITSPMTPAKTSATTVAPKIALASRACCHACRRGNNIFPNKFAIMMFSV